MSNNLVLGRGQVFFDRFADGTTNRQGERYLGSTAAFSVSGESQELDHYSSEQGLRVLDESVTLQIDLTGTMTVENMTAENVALFFFGDSETASISAATGETEDFTVIPGHYYQLGMTDTKPEGVENVDTVAVVLDPVGANSTMSEGTDYEVDLQQGFVRVLEGGAATEGDTIRVTYNIGAQTQSRVKSGTKLIQGAVRFRSYNGVGGQRNFYMPKVTLRPNGEFQLKGEEWQNIGFNLQILQPGTALSALLATGRGVTT